MKKIIAVSILILLTAAGCITTKEKKVYIYIPEGIDSLTALEADTLAEENFVLTKDEIQEKNELIKEGKDDIQEGSKYQKLSLDFNKAVSAQDSTKAIEEFNEGASAIKQAFNWLKTGGYYYKDEKERALKNFKAAENKFRKALSYNPRDEEALVWLSIALEQQEKYFEAIDVYNNLIKFNRGNPDYYYKLGLLQYKIEEYNKSIENTHKAVSVHKEVSESEVPVDYKWQLADSYLKIYQGEDAMRYYKEILPSLNEEDRKEIKSIIEWINWDGGNIRTVELRDKALKFENDKNWLEAIRNYEMASAQAKLQTTKNWLNWRAAILKYQHTDKLNGLNVMQIVYYNETEKSEFADTYGLMLYNYGVEQKNLNANKRAFTYFLQSSKVDWKDRGSAYVELADLSVNNPVNLIKYGEKALMFDLDDKDKKRIYEMLSSAFRKLENWVKMREYQNKWKEMQ